MLFDMENYLGHKHLFNHFICQKQTKNMANNINMWFNITKKTKLNCR